MPHSSLIEGLSTDRIALKPLGPEDRSRRPGTPPLAPLRPISPAIDPWSDRADGESAERPERSDNGRDIEFAITASDSGAAIGHTRLWDIDRGQARAALGSIWSSLPGDDRLIDSHVTYLLLRFGFESLACRRLELKSDARNRGGSKLLRRHGFRFEGVLRSFELGPDGQARDIAVWSVILPEWRRVRRSLEIAMAIEASPWKDRLPMIMPP